MSHLETSKLPVVTFLLNLLVEFSRSPLVALYMATFFVASNIAAWLSRLKREAAKKLQIKRKLKLSLKRLNYVNKNITIHIYVLNFVR